MQTVNIYYIKHSERISEEIFEKFLLMVPDFFQAEIKAYKHWETAQASLLGKMLLLQGLKKLQLYDSLNDLKIVHKDRPFLDDKIDFNISHSGEYVAVAITQNGKTGIDVEKHRELDVALFRKYFDDNEWKEIQTAFDPLQTFFDLWAIKESAIKCDGRGVEVLSETHVLSRLTTPGGLTANKIICDGQVFYFEPLHIDHQYACCVCRDTKFDVNLEHLTILDLKNI